MTNKFIDMSGWNMWEHGVPDSRLTVIERIKSEKNKRRTYWLCECNCGKHNRIIVDGVQLRNGNTKSCGCLRNEVRIENNKKYKKKYNTYDLSGEYGIGYTTKGEEFYFDLEDYDLIKDYCWRIHNRGYVACSINRGKNKPKKDFMMHILIMGGYDEELNVKNNVEVDHINGSSSRNDNRKKNLRSCTHQENMCNYGMPSHNTSGIIGVSWDATHSYWVAYITYKNKKMKIGSYANKEDAIVARLKAEKKYFKEFAPQQHLFEFYDIDNKNMPLTVRESGKVSRVLNYFINNKTASTTEISDILGKTKLSAIVSKLKKRGYDITSEYVYNVDEFGKRRTTTIYTLNKK